MTADPFRIRDHVAGFEAQVAGYREASAHTRQALSCRLDLSFGDGPSDRLDLFFPSGEGPWPIHLFVHGGYWRAFSRKDYSFVADSVTATGVMAAVMDYPLMPSARMESLVDAVRRAAWWLFHNASGLGGAPGLPLTASGHSAGAHLACFLQARAPGEQQVALPPVSRLLLLSGIYDLQPITKSFLQAEINLTEAEARRWSPVGAKWSEGRNKAVVALGERETPPFHAQAAALSDGRAVLLAGEDHMSVVRALGTPGTAAANLLAAGIQSGRSKPRKE